MKTTRAILPLSVLFVALANSSAHACAACWNPAGNEKMTNAAAVGIGAMVIIMFAMFGAIFAVVRQLAWRAKHPLPDYNELLAEDPSSANPEPPETKS
jgi:hypothetical protein